VILFISRGVSKRPLKGKDYAIKVFEACPAQSKYLPLYSVEDEEAMKSSLLSSGETKPSEIEMTGLDEPLWMMHYREFCILLKEVDSLRTLFNIKRRK